ncbi:TonB-dependent receptor plug domain-containing protein [Roseobacter sp. HKCCA0434]|uniref:TonB-dependent receptor plug domain-containing protein n=1 Tax=Roseobacter sp. HKCCA0434 TaxID=3079297 RepID=UPI002905C4E5|nr:TonB-dependent receptor [Roseobacter sp. HKCCA0434]
MTRTLLLATTAAILATAAQAQDAPVDLGTLVLSGSLSPVAEGRTGASVEIVDGDVVEERDGRVLDTLVRLPGVNATSNGGLGTLGSLQLRGLPARYVATRIDGIDVSDPSGTQIDFNFGNFLGAGVDRIEVLKGSQSALYGSEAIGGVVDITSFRPERLGFSGEVRGEAGSFETYSGSLSLGYLTDRSEVALTYGQVKSEGISARSSDNEKDGFEQSSLSFTVAHDLSGVLTVGGALLYSDSELELDDSRTVSTGESFSDQIGGRVYAQLDTGIVSHELSLSAYEIDRRFPTGFVQNFEGQRRTIAYLGSVALDPASTLNVGLDYTEEETETDSTTGSEENASVFAEALHALTDRIDLSAAVRYDDNSDFGGEATSRLAAAWRPVDDWTLRASLGTGYRAPSLFERFSAYGDPALQPETSRSAEIGVERQFGAAGFVKATAFYTEIEDLIDFDGAATACGSGFGCYNQVPGTTTSRGVELSGEAVLTERVALYGAYTYTDAETEGGRLTRTPRHDLVVGLDAEFTQALSGHVDVRHVADIEASPFAPAGNLVGDYTLVGVGASYGVTPDVELYVRVENLFDEDYETAGGYNQPGRAAYIGARAAF